MPDNRYGRNSVVLAYGTKWKQQTNRKKEISINYFDGARVGVYVLFSNRKTVYLGNSEIDLEKRLNDHTKDHLKTKWDSCSWFITEKSYVSDLEALVQRMFFSTKDIGNNVIKARFISAKKHYQD